MGYVIDILILLFFVLFIVKNSRKTQIRVILETICFAMSAIVAVPISIFLSELCYSNFFRTPLANKISTVVAQSAFIESTTTDTERLLDQLPSIIRNAAHSYQTITEQSTKAIESLLIGDVQYSPVKIVDILAKPVIEGIFRAIFFLVLFCGLLYLFKSLAAFIENIMYTPDRSSYNVVLGSVFGCFKGMIVLMLIITVMQLVLPALPFSIPLVNENSLNGSFLFRMFYDQNAIMLFLGKGIYPISFH